MTKVGAVTALSAELPSTLPAQKFNLFSFRVYISKIEVVFTPDLDQTYFNHGEDVEAKIRDACL